MNFSSARGPFATVPGPRFCHVLPFSSWMRLAYLAAKELEATNTEQLGPDASDVVTSHSMDFSSPPGSVLREVRFLRLSVAERTLFVGERGALALASRTARSPQRAKARRTFAPDVRLSRSKAACRPFNPEISSIKHGRKMKAEGWLDAVASRTGHVWQWIG